MFSVNFKNLLPYILIVIFAVYMFQGILAPGFMSGHDNSIHYYESYYLTKTLIPQYHWISGWSMQGMAGCPILLHHPQTGFLLVAFLNIILSLDFNLSYKLIVLFSYIFFAAAFYKLSSSRFGKAPSLFITFCLMLQKSIYCDNILDGLWNHFLGIGLFLIFFHLLDKYIKSLAFNKATLLGLLLGLTIPTHLFAATAAFLVLFIYFIPYLADAFRKKNAFKSSVIYASIPLLACMISSYYLYGFIASRNYLSRVYSKDILTGITWSLKSFFGPIEGSFDNFTSFIIDIPVIIKFILVLFGLYMFLRKKDNPEIKRFIVCLACFVIISVLFFSEILSNLFNAWRNIPLIGSIETNRFIVYVQVGTYLFAAYGFSRVLSYFRRKVFINGIFLMIIPGLLLFNYIHIARNASQTLEASPVMQDVFNVWSWVDKNISPGTSRVVYQNTIDSSGDPILRRSDVFALSGVFTKIPQIGVFLSASRFPQEKYMRNDKGNIFSKDIEDINSSYIESMMNCFNAGYIVSVEPRLKNLLGTSDLFIKEKDFGQLAIFRLKNFDNQWIKFEKQTDYEIREFNNQNVKFLIINNSDNNKGLIKISYHPFWQACLGGKPIGIKEGKYSLIEIFLPKKGSYELDLAFNYFNPFWATVSLLTLIGTGLIMGFNSAKRTVFFQKAR